MAGNSTKGRSRKAAATNKRKVVMRSVGMAPTGDILNYEATDYVPEDILDVYVADAQTRWQFVNVEDGYDAGPGGVDGPTEMPAHLAGLGVNDFAAYGTAVDPNRSALHDHIQRMASLTASQAADDDDTPEG